MRTLTFIGKPLAGEPAWAAKVPRWQQLDPASLALVEAWHAWDPPAPDVFILATPAASNAADVAFARSGAISPAKFVATLPSVTLSALLQVTGWVGPMLCLQGGPDTLAQAHEEAGLLVTAGGQKRVAVLSCDLTNPDAVIVRYDEVSA